MPSTKVDEEAAACWWAHWDSNPEPKDYAYHFGFRRQPEVVRGLDCAFTMDDSLGASVSSLYTFPIAGLGSALAWVAATGSVRRIYGGATPGFLPARPI